MAANTLEEKINKIRQQK